MIKLVLKFSDVDAGMDRYNDAIDNEYHFEKPFSIGVTFALGPEGEEGINYYRLYIESAKEDMSPDMQETSDKHSTWYVDSVNNHDVKTKIDEILELANKADNPFLEAGKYLDWEYAQPILTAEEALGADHWEDED